MFFSISYDAIPYGTKTSQHVVLSDLDVTALADTLMYLSRSCDGTAYVHGKAEIRSMDGDLIASPTWMTFKSVASNFTPDSYWATR